MLKKLGRKPTKYDRRTLQFQKYLVTMPYAPQTSHWENAAPLGMLMNDTIGDCTIAAALHMERIWSKQNKILYTPSDSDALSAYEAVGGYVPGNPATDNGCACLDVLNYWRTTGIGGRKIGAFVQVNPKNHMHVEHAAFFFGGVYVGINMPVSAQSQTLVWDVPPQGLTGDGTPGSWGGHCIDTAGYSNAGHDTITWGERITMTWRFWDAYVEECYAIVSPDFITNPVKAPNGFNMVALMQDLQLITG